MHLMSFGTFTNREHALAIWLATAVIWMLLQPKIRNSFLRVISALFQWKLLIGEVCMTLYVALVVFVFHKMHFWDWTMFKETIYWFLGTAFVSAMNHMKAHTDNHYFRKLVVSNLQFALFIEFIANLYTFSFHMELFLMPLLIMLGVLIAFAETDKKYADVRRVLNWVFIGIGLTMLGCAIVGTINDFANFATVETLKDFLLHPILTLAFLPFLYLLALSSRYEMLFFHFKYSVGKNSVEAAAYLRRKTLLLCNFNLKKLNSLSDAISIHLWSITNVAEAANVIRRFQNGTLSADEEYGSPSVAGGAP